MTKTKDIDRLKRAKQALMGRFAVQTDPYGAEAGRTRSMADGRQAWEQGKDLLDTAGEYLLALDQHLKIVFANLAFCQASDTALERIQGQVLYEINGRQWDNPALREFLQAMLSRNSYLESTWIEQHDKPERRLLRLNTRTHRNDDNSLVILLAMKDVTGHQEEEAKFQALFKSAPDAMVVADSEGTIELVNDQAESLFGYEREEMVGEPVEMLMPENLRHQHKHRHDDYLDDPHPRLMGKKREYPAQTKDGRELPVEISLSPIKVADELLVASTIHDISKRKSTEQDLKTIKEEAERANRAKSRFLATVSHDLRQPLQSIAIFQHLLSTLVTDPEIRKFAEKIGDAVEIIKRLINTLLNVDQLERGVITPKITDIPVSELFNQMQSEFEYSAKGKGLELHVVPCTATVRSDPNLLVEVIQNLLNNAIKYTQQGKILLGCRRRGKNLRIEVRDTGIGIPEDQLQLIFKEFYQVDNPDHENQKGVGLGLAIIQRIINLLHHTLEIHSTPGKGSLFAVEVPLADSKSSRTAAEALSTPQEQNQPQASILLIEDEPDLAVAMQRLLKINRFQVSTAASAEQAIAALKEADDPPELVICDYYLEGSLKGPEAVQQIRATIRKAIPVVLITGDILIEQSLEAEIAPCQILYKPIDSKELISIVRQLL